MPRDALLVMAYGTPRDLDDVEAYYTHIRHGRPPDPAALAELRQRYAAIGGRSPLLEITRAQAAGLEQRLQLPVLVGQKHSSPFISDAVGELVTRAVDRAVGLAMAPHYSSMSIGGYHREVLKAAEEEGWPGHFEMIESWHLLEGWLDLQAEFLRAALATLPAHARNRTVIFTAHSLPEAILRTGDPYSDQLHESAAAISARAGVSSWRVAWQSASPTGQPWLGPDLLEVLDQLAGAGAQGVVVCPCGFVSDHLEILFDVDIEARRRAAELGLELARTQSPNDDPRFLDALAGLVRTTLADPVPL
ncbi:MAG TPA: ferrochelatase [Actinomycetota bacterium]|nr:ferrochelatase [Actinomycetota bacterium]